MGEGEPWWVNQGLVGEPGVFGGGGGEGLKLGYLFRGSCNKDLHFQVFRCSYLENAHNDAVVVPFVAEALARISLSDKAKGQTTATAKSGRAHVPETAIRLVFPL